MAKTGLGLRTLARRVALGLLAWHGVAQVAPAANDAEILYRSNRKVKVPFEIKPEDLTRYREIQLMVSADQGASWSKAVATTPDRRDFVFAATKDGEYWLTTRTIDVKGRPFPPSTTDLQPMVRVVIDTKPPSIVLDARPRVGNLATLSWEIFDEYLDPKTLKLEFLDEDRQQWVPIPVRKVGRLGVEQWDAGTSEAIKVRGSIADRAGNVQTASIRLKDGSTTDEPYAAPADLTNAQAPPAIGAGGTGGGLQAMPSMADLPDAEAMPSGSVDPFSRKPSATPSAYASESARRQPAASQPSMLVSSPRFALQYAVDDAGPRGPAAVELWTTTDNGQTWTSQGGDPDRTSPFPVDLKGEGTFGLKLVAKSAADQGDQPPRPGEAPETRVEVDSTGPSLKLEAPKMKGNRLIISWRCDDPHPAKRPVLISVKADAPDARWQLITPSPLENTGQYAWVLPASCPARIHIRIDARDALGNSSFVDTTASGSVVVDQTQPKGRILGLDIPKEANRTASRPYR